MNDTIKHGQQGNIRNGANGYWAVCICKWVSTPQQTINNARRRLSWHQQDIQVLGKSVDWDEPT